MSWKKYFKTYDGCQKRMPASTGTGVSADADTKRYSSWPTRSLSGSTKSCTTIWTI